MHNTFQQKPKILFLVTEDWYFCSHRLPLAIAARDEGFEVVIATRIQRHGDIILKEGFKLIPIRLRRKNRNPLKEIWAVIELINIYRRERPDIVHHVAMKPVLYGSISAYITRIPAVINALAGMGYVFTSRHLFAQILNPIIKVFFKSIFNKSNNRVIVQNPDDFMFLKSIGIEQKHIIMIRGSGVNINQFRPSKEPVGIPVIVMASRMLWDKGVKEFVYAANNLLKKGLRARFVLVGGSDSDNPSAIPPSQLKAWHDSGEIEWLGHIDNMPEVFAMCHIVCLPSYREGVPKVLLEAAACGCPIVTTDMPGCREIVRDGENGILVPVKDPLALADAIQRLIENPELRKRMGLRGREIAVSEFSIEKVVQETLAVYRELMV